MPGIVRKRPSAVITDDEDEQSETSSPVSTGSKRPRHERSRAGAQNDDYDEDNYSEEPHQPGSIVRAALKNFVTYTSVEFHPGPSLNMVIGPNGTGKSTLVCAICLGLGWDPKNLGRAKDIGEFVKHGSTDAVVEIELAAAPHHQSNPVIKRIIKKEGNKSAFFINGRQSTQKEVVKLAKSFNIQIDNLCQFLPQDRVVEFAQLSPVALLKETLRAAAPEQMVLWHEELKTLRNQEKRLEIEQTNEDALLNQLKTKQNATREDVERFHRRQELVMRQKALERCRPVIETNLLRKEIKEISREKKEAERELQRLTAEAAPARAAQQEMEVYQAQVEAVVKQRRAHVERARQRADGFVPRIKAEKESMETYAGQMKAEQEDNKKRKKDQTRLEGVIANLDRQMQQEPVEVDENDYAARRREINEQKIALAARGRDLQNEMEDLKRKGQEVQPMLQRKTHERAQLNTQSGKQASLLQRISPDTAKGWDWFVKNRHTLELKGEVCGPPILTCSVRDPAYADIVEAQFGGVSDATALTFTHPDDQRLVSNKLLGEQRLHSITFRLVTKALSFYRPPCTQQELQSLGFEGWTIDYIQGPEPVLAMLCDSAQLHRAAYTSRTLSEAQHSAVEHNSPINSWVADRQKFSIKRRREYNASSTRVTTLRPAQYFTDQQVDADYQRELDDEISRLTREKDLIREQHDEVRKRVQDCQQEREQNRTEMENFEEEFRRLRKAKAAWETLPDKKAEKQSELDELTRLTKETGNRILVIKAKSEKTALTIASIALEYQKAVNMLRVFQENLVEAEIRLVEASSEVDALKHDNADIERGLAELGTTVTNLEARRTALKTKGRRLVAETQKILDTLTEEESALVDEYAKLESMEDLTNEIEAVEARLGMMADGNPQAVKAYENREVEIEKKEESLSRIEGALDETRSSITEIRAQWEPRLDELIATISDGFSHNFDKIGCAGQVGVHKDEDFEAWSIQIQVRFRENEALSILDSHRQSGGERAVSTIFYLMALQDLARSPFRVVDEINQGMDPRNERMVHERMVDIACRERTSQYFLITPKLLSDLKFHPKMKIHCIASGEHMPSEGKEKERRLDFQGLADLAVRMRVGGVGA